MPSSSVLASCVPTPETPVCIFAPPISSSVTFSPMTISAIRGEPRYIDALPSRMITTSQKAGMYAPPAALGPNRTQTCGTTPDILRSEEHTSELQSRQYLVCRLLLEKKKQV